MQIVSIECQSLFSGEHEKKIFQYVFCWKFYPACLALSNELKNKVWTLYTECLGTESLYVFMEK